MGLRKILFSGLFSITGFFFLAQSGSIALDSFKVSGITRKYRSYIPNIYSPLIAAPVVIDLHGLASNASQQEAYSNFMPVADTAGFLLVHPDGTVNGSFQYWNAGLFQNSDDLDFLDRLIDTLATDYNIDKNRIFFCGISNGGVMSYYFSCQRPGKLAAIASVAGTMFRPWFFNCQPAFALPVMEIHGTNDGTIPYNGNASGSDPGAYLSTDSVIDKWRNKNGCDSNPLTYSLADISGIDGSTAVNYRYLNGVDGSAVELIKVNGGSHSWPGAINIITGTNQDFSASVEIWRFFRQFKKSQFVHQLAVTEIEINSDWRIYPVPCKSHLMLPPIKMLNVRIFDLNGKEILHLRTSEKIFVGDLVPGIYFVQLDDEKRSETFKFIKE